jgi:membrane-bound toxin of toxin-antitoxin system
MSSPGFSDTLDLSLKPSAGALRWLVGLHALAIVLTLLADPPRWAGLAMVALFIASWFSLRRHSVFGYGPRALVRLVWHREGGWTLEDARGRREEAELSGRSLVQSWGLVLSFKLKTGGSRVRVLLGDEVGPDLLRRLRARLLAGV